MCTPNTGKRKSIWPMGYLQLPGGPRDRPMAPGSYPKVLRKPSWSPQVFKYRWQVTSDRWQVLSGRGPAAGGRRPLNPATEPFRAKGTAVAKRYRRGGSSSCRSFKPFPSKLVYSRFPPGPRRLPWDPVFLQWRCFPAFSTCQTGRHRQGVKTKPTSPIIVTLRCS